MRVVSVHDWPYDANKVEAEFLELGGDRDRIEQCHQTAWLVVVEVDGPASSFDADDIAYQNEPDLPRDNWQAAWLEEILEDTVKRSRVALFLHEYAPSGRLFYGETEQHVPERTPLPSELTERVSYQSP